MKNSSFRFSIFPLILLLCLIFSCEQQGEKMNVKKKAKDDLQLDKIPKVVMDALEAKFPQAEIHKWTKEIEGDIVVYDIEFKQVDRKFEADIKEDGTIHNWEKEITDKDFPEAFTKAVETKYPRSTIREIMEITAVNDGKDALEGYEIVLETTDNKEVELTVAPDGKILENSGEKKFVDQEPQAPDNTILPIRIGMTWDECVPLLKDAKRITLTRHNSDRFTDTYQIGDRGYHLTFERPSSPDVGPYRVIRIEHAEIKPETDQIDEVRQLKRGMSMSEALPIMQKVGGYFVLETKDRFAAILQTSDGTYRVTFERPKGLTRPSVIADATPKELTMSGHIPLNALPEFGEYRITSVKKNN